MSDIIHCISLPFVLIPINTNIAGRIRLNNAVYALNLKFVLWEKVSPKACGHTQGRKVVSREEAVMRIRAAVDARKESGSDIVIVARSDSCQAISFEESLWRSRAFADAGADVLFIDALTSREQMKSFCDIAPLVPKMVSHYIYGHLNAQNYYYYFNYLFHP